MCVRMWKMELLYTAVENVKEKATVESIMAFPQN